MSDVTVERDLVTVRDYARFLEHDPGVTHPLHWTEQSAYPENPVVGITHHEAVAYCAWVVGRLPTEAEWDAARPTLAWGLLWEWTATPGELGTFVVRGGSWYYFPVNLRAAYRYYFTPDSRLNLFGFRCARAV